MRARQGYQTNRSDAGPADPLSFGGAVFLLLLVGAAASYVPARRALDADPSAALRSQ